MYVSLFLFLVSLMTVFGSQNDFNSFSRNFQIQVKSESIPVRSAMMPNHFLDLTADLSKDGNDVTCSSSDWVGVRRIEYRLDHPRRVHAVALLLHKYVDVHLNVSVGNVSGGSVWCNTLQTNTGSKRDVNVVCGRELYGDLISITDLRPTNEFLVICEVNVFGAPGTLTLSDTDPGTNLLGVYIGCGVALLILVVVIILVFLCKGRRKPRRPSEAHSLNTLSMMSSDPSTATVMHRRPHPVSSRGPVPSPRPPVVRSIPNAYDRPISTKDTSTIYETIPGEEPSYLLLMSEKELYDDASSMRKNF